MQSTIMRSLLAFLALVTLTASAQQSPFEPARIIEAREGYAIERAVLTDRDIPVLLLRRTDAAIERRPVVFLVHGGGMPDINASPTPWAKEGWFDPEYFDVPYTLADGGLMVALIDTWWAGERFRPEYRDIVKQNYLAALIRGYVETARDVSLLIDALADRRDTDASRIGVTGRSGGGIIALMAATHDPRITAITSWVGSADLMTWAHGRMPERTVQHFVSRAPEIIEMLNEFDPINRPADLPPAAVLLINNRNDPFVPFDTADALYEKLLPHYSDIPERLRRIVLDPPKPTHAMTKADYDEGCAWLVRHLNE